MKKALQNLSLISILFISSFSFCWDISKGFLHPQLAGQGNAGIALPKTSMAAFKNPAILGHQNGWNFYWYQALFENGINNQHFQLTYPWNDFNLSLTYYSQHVGGIPITEYINERIRQNGSFSAGIYQWRLSVGKKFSDFYAFKDFDLGYSLGYQKYTFIDQTDLYHRIGFIFSTYFNKELFFGSSIDINLNSTGINYGIGYKQEAYQIALDYEDNQVKTGVEYKIYPYFSLRGGIEDRYYTMGMGIFYDRLYGPVDFNLALNFDFVYMIPRDEKMYSPLSYFAFTIQENRRLAPPLIYQHPTHTNQKVAIINGWGPKNSTIWLYIDKKIVNKTLSNQNGQWEIQIPLNKELNKVQARTVQERGNKQSNLSKPVEIRLDNNPPTFNFTAIIRNNKTIDIRVNPSELLGPDPKILTNKNGKFTISYADGKYWGRFNTKYFDKYFHLEIEDLAGNKRNTKINNPFLEFQLPKKRNIITNKNKFLFNVLTKPLAYIKVKSVESGATKKVNIDSNGQFETVVPLQYGKNTIVFEDYQPYGKFIYPFYISRLFEFNDTENQDFKKLATIGVIPMEPNFKPTSLISQKQAISWLTNFKEIKFPSSPPKNSIEWLNEAYNYALIHRWIENRDDEQIITRKISMDMFQKALPMDIHSTQKEESYFKNIDLKHPYLKTINYFVEHGFIQTKEKKYWINKKITKQEFVYWLTKTAQLEVVYKHFFEE